MEHKSAYLKAKEALDEAYLACYNHKERDVLGMSHGPFSGVNVALSIIKQLEDENTRLRKLLDET